MAYRKTHGLALNYAKLVCPYCEQVWRPLLYKMPAENELHEHECGACEHVYRYIRYNNTLGTRFVTFAEEVYRVISELS